MYKFIQKNQKKFLAVFGVLLMIVFILPSSFKNNLSRGDLTIGTVDGEKITGFDLGQARSDLDLLRQYEFLPLIELGGGADASSGAAEHSVVARYFHGDDGALNYLLLQKEAKKLGFSISPQAADSVVAAEFKNMQLSQDVLDQVTPAVGRFMLVQAAFDRASEAVKASKPLMQYYLAERYQGIKLNLVEYSAAELEKSVPPPTPDQIQQQYDKYGDAYPVKAMFLTTQPSTPGYKVPDRVKLQYLELPHAAVVDSVLNELSPDALYQFDRDAGYPYYEKHQSEFPAPPMPATLPAFGPAGPALPTSLPATTPATASIAALLPATVPAGPTTKPFDDVKVEIRKRLLSDPSLSSVDQVAALRARVTDREKQLQTALHVQLAQDYVEWSAAHSGVSPATLPVLPTTNPLIAIYPDLDFLTAFADTFEAKYKVRPLVNSLANKWLTQQDLETTPEIGSARAGETTFAEFAMRDLAAAPAPILGPAGPPAPPTSQPAASTPAAIASALLPATLPSFTSWNPVGTGLRPFEPSTLLQDSNGNAFVFRLTAFEPAHRPPLADVGPEIVSQLKQSAAYRLAHDQAAKLLSNAQVQARLSKEQKLPDDQGLPAAAVASGQKLIKTDTFQPRNLFRARKIPNYEPTDFGDNIALITGVSALAKQQTPDNMHPSTLIELPAEHKVLVAEIGETLLPVPADEMFVADEAMTPMARNALQSGQFLGPQSTPGTSMLQDWFDQTNVMARVKYVKAKGS
jgi:hypothetical protein